MSRVRDAFRRLADLIDGFRPAVGPPPRRLWPFVRWCLSGAWPMIVLAAVVSGLAGLMEVGAAYLLGAVVDSTVAANPPAAYFGESLVLVLVYVGFYLLVRPLFFGMSAAFNGIVLPPNLAPLVQSRLHRWSLGQDVAFFDDDFAGRIAQKQTQTATALVGVVTEAVNAIAFSLATLIGAVAMLAVVDGRIAACLAIWLVLYFGLMRWYLPRIRARSKARAAARANVTGQIVDTITNVKTVKLFGHARFEDRAALDALRGFREQALRFGLLSTGFRFVLMAAAGALPVVLVLAALLLWRAGSVTPGEIAATGALAMRIAQMTGWVSFTLMAIFSNMGEVEDGMRTLTAPHRVVDKPDAIDLEKAAGRIVFDGVGFAYGRRIGGVRGMDLTVEPGEKLGIVGASGAGKSTLVSLLLRLYDPEAGRVTLDGIDLRDLTQDSLRRQIAMVTQETAMFNRSARDNILYGRPDASDAEAVAAARRAEADAFIRGLQDHRGRTGYDAHLGERGVKLSGGQRQRIALARAFLKDAPVLVLDEATSALDSEVEAAIQHTLANVMEGKTVIAIAHRLSTLSSLDRIVVLDAGRIVEEGDHRTLLARGGLYARYWSRQSGGFIGVRDAAE